ncbi:hypothetical protein JOD45_000053 [Scopulibacillus daqui]|uniref:Uncharacterized protein n=1 Tax=Scopulibacillus daqui TaxID=1469162 RepID=A0ABS2PUY7_9BACL|nr:hypothetical protein [Scopulibacillus daqui]MBM7643862.1 hypothetical protein [Scopulibacillus daqui]
MKLSKIVDVCFDHLTVNHIDNNSGIFIGNNQANGWHYTDKSNHGFGYMSNGSNKETVQIIFDNDHIDMPVVEKQYNYFQKENDEAEELNDDNMIISEQNIAFNEINVNSLHDNATVTMGNNRQNAWHAYHKENAGLGTMTNNHTDYTINQIIDNDFIDAPIDQFFQAKTADKK